MKTLKIFVLNYRAATTQFLDSCNPMQNSHVISLKSPVILFFYWQRFTVVKKSTKQQFLLLLFHQVPLSNAVLNN